jgi:hypothetical protein
MARSFQIPRFGCRGRWAGRPACPVGISRFWTQRGSHPLEGEKLTPKAHLHNQSFRWTKSTGQPPQHKTCVPFCNSSAPGQMFQPPPEYTARDPAQSPPVIPCRFTRGDAPADHRGICLCPWRKRGASRHPWGPQPACPQNCWKALNTTSGASRFRPVSGGSSPSQSERGSITTWWSRP